MEIHFPSGSMFGPSGLASLSLRRKEDRLTYLFPCVCQVRDCVLHFSLRFFAKHTVHRKNIWDVVAPHACYGSLKFRLGTPVQIK